MTDRCAKKQQLIPDNPEFETIQLNDDDIVLTLEGVNILLETCKQIVNLKQLNCDIYEKKLSDKI